ncbi:MAG TPA: hypothetical protein VGP72_25440 [Planctomycetota bacterium]|jgi:uncharacterized Zn finger protein
MNSERRHQVLEALKEKGVAQQCSRCGWTRLAIIGENTIRLDQQHSAGKVNPFITTVLVSCTNCGAVTQHRKDALGLSESDE